MKILHITPMYPNASRPAFGIFVKSQIDSLKQYVDIDLLVLPGLRGIWPYFGSIPDIYRKLRNDYDIIHIHYGNVSSFVKMLYWGKMPIVTSYCGDDLLGTITSSGRNTLKSEVFMKLNRFLSRSDSYAIVKSDELASRIRGVSPNIAVIPNGVDTVKFQPIDKTIAREKLGIEATGKKVILFPANPSIPRKNFALLERVIDNLSVKDRVKVLVFKDGQVNPDMVPIYINAADLVVLPSFVEGSPNVVKESMACNAKIVASDSGDVPWLLGDVKGSAALPLKEEVWLDFFKRYFDNQFDGEESNSREMLLNKGLDLDSVARQVYSVYQHVLDNRKKK